MNKKLFLIPIVLVFSFLLLNSALAATVLVWNASSSFCLTNSSAYLNGTEKANFNLTMTGGVDKMNYTMGYRKGGVSGAYTTFCTGTNLAATTANIQCNNNTNLFPESSAVGDIYFWVNVSTNTTNIASMYCGPVTIDKTNPTVNTIKLNPDKTEVFGSIQVECLGSDDLDSALTYNISLWDPDNKPVKSKLTENVSTAYNTRIIDYEDNDLSQLGIYTVSCRVRDDIGDPSHWTWATNNTITVQGSDGEETASQIQSITAEKEKTKNTTIIVLIISVVVIVLISVIVLAMGKKKR